MGIGSKKVDINKIIVLDGAGVKAWSFYLLEI